MENHNKENRRMLMSSRVLKPSPNEEEAILKGVTAERKKLRLLQVRKQQKKLSGKVLNAVKSKQAKEINSLKMQLQDEWERKVFSELQDLEREYENRLKTLGEGHKSVSQVPVKDMSKSEELMNQRAKERHQEALRKLAEQRASLRMMEDEKSKLRLRVAAEEQARAATVASKPPPAPDFILKPESKSRGSTLSSKSKSIESFSSTRFHMPVVYAEKADQTTKQVDAREAAKKHEERVLQERELLDKDLNERKEKANLRHQHARQQVLLDQSKDRLMMQLEDLEFKDRVRRQQVLGNIPKQVFQPPYQRLEDARSRQVMLEEVFENAHMPKQDTRKEELRLDLDSHLDVTETDLSQPNDNADEDEMVESKESADPSSESQARLPDETEFDKSENASSREPPQQTKAESSNKVPKDPSSRMQKLMSRIRKQQEEWTKQKANRESQVSSNLDSQDENGQSEDDSETTGSLVSADIESARFASSNGESAQDEKDGQETAQPKEDSKKEDSSPSKPENDSLLHPFEKAKLVRSANSKEGSVKQFTDPEVLSDVTKRKKTLENQKYLLKIQKQRLENELLRQNLQQTGKELDDLIKQDDESSGTFEVVVDVSADSTSSSSQGIEEISPDNERNSAKNSTQKTLLTSKDFSFLNGLSASQQKELSKRYPNIFSGFLTGDATIDDSRDGDATRVPVQSSGDSTNVQRPTTSITDPPGEKDNMRLSKSRVDHERIRKYQEQLLQKQRWLKSRQEVMQKRFPSHGKVLGQLEQERPAGQEDTGKQGGDVAFEASKAKGVAETTEWPKISTMSGSTVQTSTKNSLTEEARYYPLKESNTVEEEGVRAEIQQRQIEADIYKTDTEAAVRELATLLSQTSSLNKRQSVYEQLQALRSKDDKEQKSHRQTNSFVELIPQTARSGEQNGIEEIYMGRNMSSRSIDLPVPRASVTLPESRAFAESRHQIEDAPKQSNINDLLNSMDFLTVDEPLEVLGSHVSKTLDNTVKKNQRIVSGKPTFSPIQEVEETSLREKSMENKVVQGTASVSSLTEQELPMSMKSSSGHSHSSLRSSGASGGKSDASSALSFHELISNFSETEFLTLPTALRAVNTRPIEEAALASHNRPRSSTRELQSSFDNWTPLVADYSEVGKDDRRIEESKDTRDNIDFVNGKTTSNLQDLFAFDREKFRRIIQEKLPADFLSNSEKQSAETRYYQPSNGGIDIFSPVKLQGIIERISASNVHALPPSDSRPAEHQDKKVSNSNYESSMRETSPVLTENSPSSSVTSKVSSTNITRYEEILAKVRMLPHQHQEEYNRLAESYRSWRKEAVEPLLHPDVPDPFAGYELFSGRDKSEPALQEANKVKIEHTGGKPQSENLLGTIPKTKDTSPERLQNHLSLVARLGESRISVYEPVRGIELPEAAIKEKATVEEDTNEPQTWKISDFMGTGSLPDAWGYNKTTFYGEKEASLVSSEGENSPDYSNENYIEIPGAFMADHLMEQKLFESTEFENSPTLSRTGALASDKEEVVETSRMEIENKELSMNGGDSFIENTMLESQDRGDRIDRVPGVQTSPADPIDIEALQKQYLDNYLSTLMESSATKSSLTNSSSQKTRSQFSSEFRSDETVSELVRLWPSSSKTMIEGAEASQASTAISGPDQTHASSVAIGSRSGVNVSDSLGEVSSGFKNPNHYDITVHRSRQTKSEKTTISGNSSKSTSFKDETDSNFSMPSFPRFASTRLEKGGRPTSPSLSETSLEPTGDNGLDGSVLSNFDYDADVGHSETSWLLSSDNVKGDASHVSDIRLGGPAFTQDGLIDDSNKSLWSGSSVEKPDHSSEPEDSTKLDRSYENSSDDVISTWDDLLAKEAPLSSAKESDSDLPDTVRLKRDAFMKRSRERLHKIKENAASHEKKADKFRIDGKVEKAFKAENRENKEPARHQKTPRIPPGVTGVRNKERAQGRENTQDRSRAQISAKQPERRKKPTKQEALQENRRKMKQFEKKIQSSLRSRRK
ncbi:uncharacterized protein LOC135684257 [Rhopilema esculentum]|uniref:uncharacterized protein LOC135684257 n=1 Tax=Rhopilema esculentum TaxID=499914 RepID=UPI0031DE0894